MGTVVYATERMIARTLFVVAPRTVKLLSIRKYRNQRAEKKQLLAKVKNQKPFNCYSEKTIQVEDVRAK